MPNEQLAVAICKTPMDIDNNEGVMKDLIPECCEATLTVNWLWFIFFIVNYVGENNLKWPNYQIAVLIFNVPIGVWITITGLLWYWRKLQTRWFSGKLLGYKEYLYSKIDSWWTSSKVLVTLNHKICAMWRCVQSYNSLCSTSSTLPCPP